MNISIPIHLRYHKAAKKEKFVPVSLSPPTILGKCNHGKCIIIQTAALLAQLGERRSAEWEVAGSNPGRTNTQGL